MPKRPYPNWQRRYDAILLYLAGHPAAKQKDIAKATGYSASQISRILCSVDFQLTWDELCSNQFVEARVRYMTSPRPSAG